jgi:hypothetical protein
MQFLRVQDSPRAVITGVTEMKANVAKSDTAKPKAVDVLTDISEIVLRFREDKPTIAAIARVTNRASHLLRIGALDERLEVENAATVQLAKKHGLMS